MTRMPPQAYTKEVLASAFDWLSRQDEAVKKSIRTSDDLVGLFLKSTRLNENQNLQKTAHHGYSSDLSSAKSFRNELQGLALNLKQFEEKPAPKPKQERSSEYLHELNLMMSAQKSQASTTSNTNSTEDSNHSISRNSASSEHGHLSQHDLIPESQPSRQTSADIHPPDELSMSTPNKNSNFSQQNIDSAETVLLKLDKKTISAINIAKDRLNLSSNTEAIRVLVSLGEKHLKKVFGSED